MSLTKIRPYGRIYDISHISKDISLTEIAVYGYLCYRAGSTGSCYPSQRRIAADLHVSRDRVISAIRHLVAAGLISVQRIHTKGQRRYMSRYEISSPTCLPKTYGQITELMMAVCADLSCGSIGLWFYTTSAAGTGNDLYFNRAELASRLNISARTLTKYINELVEIGEATAFREMIQGSQVTRFVVRPMCNISTFSPKAVTLGLPSNLDLSNQTLTEPDETNQPKINRESYLSLDDCKTSSAAINKQAEIRKEMQEIYQCSDMLTPQTDATYEDVAPRLHRFVRNGASRAEILRVVKTDLRYLLAFLRRFPRSWIADPLIRSAALEVLFGTSSDAATKTVMDQLFWILGAEGDEQNRLISHIDNILSGSKDARTWLSSLVGRASAALATRPIQHPAAYVRRLILNWLMDRHAQTVDLISYQSDNDLSEIPAPIPQTYDELVADPICEDYRFQIQKLSRQEYRDRANAYEAIVRKREESGDPISRYDIWTDDEIVATYAVMPDTYLGFLQMIKDDEIIHTATKTELERCSLAYRLLAPQDRLRVLEDRALSWILDPNTEDEAIHKYTQYKHVI